MPIAAEFNWDCSANVRFWDCLLATGSFPARRDPARRAIRATAPTSGRVLLLDVTSRGTADSASTSMGCPSPELAA
ncbi:MAG: hypothetical protein WAN86_12060, partial [Hyphomicrobiaceae bacterium]